jgi:hypothetical protein
MLRVPPTGEMAAVRGEQPQFGDGGLAAST